MANAKIVGNVCVITSELPYEQIEKLEKFKPEALSARDEEGNDTFSIRTGNSPSFSRYGAVFNSKNQQGNALVVVSLPSVDDKAEFVKETYGYGLLSLNQLERQLTVVSEDLAQEISQIESNITIE